MHNTKSRHDEVFPKEILGPLDMVYKAVEKFNEQLHSNAFSCYHELYVYTFQFGKKDNWLLDNEEPLLFVSKGGLMNWQNINAMFMNPTFDTPDGKRKELVLALSSKQLKEIHSVEQVFELIFDHAFV
jgi:hypothetical protein